jgi:hypothetical protein
MRELATVPAPTDWSFPRRQLATTLKIRIVIAN